MARKLFLICSLFAVLLMVLAFASAAPEESVESRNQEEVVNAPKETPEAIQKEGGGAHKGTWKRQSDGIHRNKGLHEKSWVERNGAGHGEKSSESFHSGEEFAEAEKGEFGDYLNQDENNSQIDVRVDLCTVCSDYQGYAMCLLYCSSKYTFCDLQDCQNRCFGCYCGNYDCADCCWFTSYYNTYSTYCSGCNPYSS